jgi:hypothetical protein
MVVGARESVVVDLGERGLIVEIPILAAAPPLSGSETTSQRATSGYGCAVRRRSLHSCGPADHPMKQATETTSGNLVSPDHGVWGTSAREIVAQRGTLDCDRGTALLAALEHVPIRLPRRAAPALVQRIIPSKMFRRQSKDAIHHIAATVLARWSSTCCEVASLSAATKATHSLPLHALGRGSRRNRKICERQPSGFAHTILKDFISTLTPPFRYSRFIAMNLATSVSHIPQPVRLANPLYVLESCAILLVQP